MEICPAPLPQRERQRSIITIKNTICLGHDESCNCCCCSNPQPGYLKYIQPEVPKSFKPMKSYRRHELPMEQNTTYKLSYWNGPIPTKSTSKPIVPPDSLTVCDGQMTDDTIHKLSYLGNWCLKRDADFEKNSPWRTAKQWLGRGPMQNDTTHKNDFTWKCIPTSKPRKLSNNLYCPCASMTDDTTYKLSYYASNCRIPVKSFKPKISKEFKKSDVPFEECTTYKLSYWPNEVPLKTKYPWKPKTDYHPSPTPLDDCTTYRLSYWPNNNPQVRKPSKTNQPSENILNADCCFDDNTTYNLSYYECGDGFQKRQPIKPVVKPTEFSSCPLSHDTIHRMSYLGNWRIPRETSKVNSPWKTAKQWLGRGPIQDVTTHKHDFTWKRVTPDRIYTRPEDNLGFSSSPLECCTTNKLSYWPHDINNLVRDKSFKPRVDQKDPLDVPMEKETTMRLSYQPVEAALPQPKPWVKSKEYYPPLTPIDDNTIYNFSYIPPGTLEPIYCDESCPPMSDDTCQGSCNNNLLSQSSSSMHPQCCAPCGAT